VLKKHAVTTALVIMLVSSIAVMICRAEEGKASETASHAIVKVNNTICPVSGDKVNMSNPVTVEYNGKEYNLCCPACISAFKADPEKYAAKAESQSKQ